MRPLQLLLQSSALAAALFATASAATAPQEAEPPVAPRPRLVCRCQPDQPCWPLPDTWSSFNQTVGGRLIATTPVSRECHQPFYDEAKCAEIKKGYKHDRWRQLQPGAVQQTNWETIKGVGCLLNQTTCEQGAVPLYTVNASSVADIQATVRFAAQHNVRLSVKNTGHDYLGRSTAASSVNLWTYFMKKLNVEPKFIPEGAPKDVQGADAVVVGPGVLWEEVNRVLDAHKRIVVGGAEATVGAVGGYCLGGGHSPLSPRHGLCVDNVLQYTVVTADGQVRVANDYQNRDLFWALRGGGPGFGVIAEAVYRTHPALQNINYATNFVYSENTTTINSIVREFYANYDRWAKEGWSGYTYTTTKFTLMMFYLPDADLDTAKASVKPYLDYARSFSDAQVSNDTVTHHATYYDLFKTLIASPEAENAGHNYHLASRLIPASMFQSKDGVDRLASTMAQIQDGLAQIMPDGGYLTHLVAGGQVSRGNSRDTSVLPAWRRALSHIVITGGWLDTTPYEGQVYVQDTLTRLVDRLRAITPGMGAYQNEADPNEPQFQQNFFGSNYRRLKQLKKKYDRHSLFVCRRCVGSEDWDSDEVCPRRA
ncbi:hypothetical protein DFQ26_001070 [Actinomortierella ambigua]|nr:hypothetical protein DFQ26_001070 [Actinomortierella ambigua]